MAILLRRSVLGGLRRSVAPLSASRQAMVTPSLGATFLASSSGADATSRVQGTPIRSILQIQGRRHYGNAFNGTESAKESSKKKPFLEKVNALAKELLDRYWAPLRPGGKLVAVYSVGCSGFLLEMAHTTENQML